MNTGIKHSLAFLSVLCLTSCTFTFVTDSSSEGTTSLPTISSSQESSMPMKEELHYESGLPRDERRLDAFTYSQLRLEGVDALGRKVLPADAFKDGEHHVGLFYFVWLGQHNFDSDGIYDVSKLEETDEGRVALYGNTSAIDPLSPMGKYHFFAEPLYGYYNSADPWVIRKHLELFALAGIDYLCLDATNTVIYQDVVPTLLNCIKDMQEQGIAVPKVMFYTNSSSGSTVSMIYATYYRDHPEWESVWWAPAGKPRIVGITHANGGASDQTYFPEYNPSYVSDEMCAYFDVLESQWPNGAYNENGQPWMSWSRNPASGMTYGYPQKIHNGHIAVPVAQHNHEMICFSLKGNESHRGYNPETDEVEGDYREGLAFQKMFDTALNPENNVTDVFVTGWNEWIAIKNWDSAEVGYANPTPGMYMVDTFNKEYSRDLEMMKGGYGDNYYLQLVQNVRAYKTSEYVDYAHALKTIDIKDFDLGQWEGIDQVYADPANDAETRDFAGSWHTLNYFDDSGRNDIVSTRVTNDSSYLYFRIECAEDIVPSTMGDELTILLGDGAEGSGFLSSFSYRIGNTKLGGMASVDRYVDGSWERVSISSRYVEQGKVLQIAIPLSDIGFATKRPTFVFKVFDNVTDPDDPMSYYASGDSMPIGRLGYRY